MQCHFVHMHEEVVHFSVIWFLIKHFTPIVVDFLCD